MNKKFAWELFKNTGNLDAFMIMKDIENNNASIMKLENNNTLGGMNGDITNEGHSN